MSPTIGWSRFARERYRPGKGHSYFDGSETELVELLLSHWEKRRPGAGRENLGKVVLVDLPAERFICGSVTVHENTPLDASLVRRQAHEDPHIQVLAGGDGEAAQFASVVLYSAATLLENGGERSGDCDWEIVSIQASALRDEPMHPLTMARNFLAKPGGTPCAYSAREFAEAIYYWSYRCGLAADEDG